MDSSDAARRIAFGLAVAAVAGLAEQAVRGSSTLSADYAITATGTGWVVTDIEPAGAGN